MTRVADYLATSDTGERLRGGDSHDFEFTLPASADLDMDAVLALKVNASGSFERLSSTIEINGKQVLRVINKEESYQTLHEVIEKGILVPGANKVTVKVDDDERAGRGRVKFEDLVLWFKGKAATVTAHVPQTEGETHVKPVDRTRQKTKLEFETITIIQNSRTGAPEEITVTSDQFSNSILNAEACLRSWYIQYDHRDRWIYRALAQITNVSVEDRRVKVSGKLGWRDGAPWHEPYSGNMSVLIIAQVADN